MWSWHLCGNEELEIRTKGNSLIAKLDVIVCAFLFNLLSKKWVKHWIENFSSVFENNRCSHGNCSFKRSRNDQRVLSWLDYFKTFFLVAILEPYVRLHLWIYEQTPPIWVITNNCTISRETVLRKALDLPLSNLYCVTEYNFNWNVFSWLELILIEHLSPWFGALITIAL